MPRTHHSPGRKQLLLTLRLFVTLFDRQVLDLIDAVERLKKSIVEGGVSLGKVEQAVGNVAQGIDVYLILAVSSRLVSHLPFLWGLASQVEAGRSLVHISVPVVGQRGERVLTRDGKSTCGERREKQQSSTQALSLSLFSLVRNLLLGDGYA